MRDKIIAVCDNFINNYQKLLSLLKDNAKYVLDTLEYSGIDSKDREQIVSYIRDLKTLVEPIVSELKILKEEVEKLIFKVVVIGRSGVGKSTFINSFFIGDVVLPEGIAEGEGSRICVEVDNSPKISELVKVIMQNGEVREVSKEEGFKYLKEGLTGAKLVQFMYPLKFDVVIYDTLGIKQMDKSFLEELMKDSSLILYVVDYAGYAPIIKNEDREFLHNLKKDYVQRTYLILNLKLDIRRSGKLDILKEKVKEEIDWHSIYFVNAVQNEDYDGFSLLMHSLTTQLREEKVLGLKHYKLKEILSKLYKDNLDKFDEIRKKTLEYIEVVFKEKIKSHTKKIAELYDWKEVFLRSFFDNRDKIFIKLGEYLQKKFESISRFSEADIKRDWLNWDVNAYIKEDFIEFLKDKIEVLRKRLDNISEEEIVDLRERSVKVFEDNFLNKKDVKDLKSVILGGLVASKFLPKRTFLGPVKGHLNFIRWIISEYENYLREKEGEVLNIWGKFLSDKLELLKKKVEMKVSDLDKGKNELKKRVEEINLIYSL